MWKKFFSLKPVKVIIKLFLIFLSLTILLVGLDLIKYSLVRAFDPYFFVKFFGSPIKSFFLSYMMTEITMSGSPIAGAFIGLGEVLHISMTNLTSVILGTRGGVNSVLLITGLLMLIKGKSLRRALGITVIQFFVTFSVTALSALFVFPLLDVHVFANLASKMAAVGMGDFGLHILINLISDLMKFHIPSTIYLLIIGVIFLVGGLFAFDKNFSFVKDKHVAKHIRKIENRKTAFLAGFILTALTMSLSISVTLLLPLYVRKVVTRRHLVPYILGANISTLFDTLFLGVMTHSKMGVEVILTFMLAATISVIIYLIVFKFYKKSISILTDHILDNMYVFIGFLVVIMLAPLLFILG